MGRPQPHSPVLLLLAAFSRHDDALVWTEAEASKTWGPIRLKSEAFAFNDTDYYDATMGGELKKQFFAFEHIVDPACLPDLKHRCNHWEEDYAAITDHAEARPLNLDPGYISLGKLVLASTKDHAHRLYLRDGIYAEITLHYHAGGWQPHPWTYPDYRRPEFQEFFVECRDALRQMRRREDSA